MTISKRNTLLKTALMISTAICSLPLFAIANSLPRSQTAATGICETCVQESQNKNLQALLAAAQNICDAMTNPEERRRCLNRDTSNTRQNAVFLVENEDYELVDPRVRMNDPQLNAIGLVEVSGVYTRVPTGTDAETATKLLAGEIGSSSGTGFMINKCLMVTNQHVVYPSILPETFRPGTHEVHFTAGAATHGLPSRHRVKGAVVAIGGLAQSQENRFADWAIVKLERSYGSEIQPLNLNYTENLIDAEDGQRLNIAALYTDLQDGRALYGHQNCFGNSMERNTSHGRAHYCANMPGTSGAPIMVKRDGRYEVIGINSTQRLSGIVEHTGSMQGNGYIDLQTAIPKERLDQIIAANPCP